MPIQKKTRNPSRNKAQRMPFKPAWTQELLKGQMALTGTIDRLETKVAELESTVRSQAVLIGYMHTELQVSGALPNVTGSHVAQRMKLVTAPREIVRPSEMGFFVTTPPAIVSPRPLCLILRSDPTDPS
jgi:hypothetical protein